MTEETKPEDLKHEQLELTFKDLEEPKKEEPFFYGRSNYLRHMKEKQDKDAKIKE